MTSPAFSLADRAMIVSLTLRMWNGKKLDRAQSRKVTTEQEAQDDAAQVVKVLAPPNMLKPVASAQGHARVRHYSLTLPWGENSRILASPAYFDYMKAMNEERSLVEGVCSEFCCQYAQMVAEQPMRMGKLFDPRDYPSVQEIREKFGFELTVLPVPSAGDFRVELGEDIEEAIRADIEKTVQSRYVDAQRDIYERLLDTATHFVTIMKKEGKLKLHATTVTNLVEMARNAPKMSLTPDEKLEGICAQILKLTDDLEVQDLRDSEKSRKAAGKQVAKSVADIENLLAGAFV